MRNQTDQIFLQSIVSDPRINIPQIEDSELGQFTINSVRADNPNPVISNEQIVIPDTVQTQALDKPYLSRTNDLYGKMNIIVIFNMVEVLIFSITCLSILSSEPVNFLNIRYYLIVDLVIEALGLYFYRKFKTVNQ